MALDLETSRQDNITRLAVEGEVDLYTSPQLRKAVLKALNQKGECLEVVLTAVPYMDSSGVATLVEGLKLARSKGGRLVLVSPSESVMKVLQLARLDSVFEIRANPEA